MFRRSGYMFRRRCDIFRRSVDMFRRSHDFSIYALTKIFHLPPEIASFVHSTVHSITTQISLLDPSL